MSSVKIAMQDGVFFISVAFSRGISFFLPFVLHFASCALFSTCRTFSDTHGASQHRSGPAYLLFCPTVASSLFAARVSTPPSSAGVLATPLVHLMTLCGAAITSHASLLLRSYASGLFRKNHHASLRFPRHIYHRSTNLRPGSLALRLLGLEGDGV